MQLCECAPDPPQSLLRAVRARVSAAAVVVRAALKHRCCRRAQAHPIDMVERGGNSSQVRRARPHTRKGHGGYDR